MAWAVISTLGMMGRGLEQGAGCLPGNLDEHRTLPPDDTPLAIP